jgi:cobalt/nickel transport system permease protein
MHIPDGFLTNRIAVALDILSGASILYSAQRLKVDFAGRMVPIMGVLAAFVFAAQMLNFPIIGGTSGHLIGGSLLAILLGPMAAFLTITTVVIAQALFLQDGGLIALGANIFNISAVTCFSGYAVYRLLGRRKAGGERLFLAGFLAGWISSMISSACCAVQIGLSGAIPLRFGLTAMLGYHAIIGVFEGMLTAGVLSFLYKVRPDLMKIDRDSQFKIADWVSAVLFVVIPVSILFAAGSSSLPDPLQKLLAASPISAEHTADPGTLASAERYMDYLVRIAVFILLIGIGVLVAHLTRGRKGRL